MNNPRSLASFVYGLMFTAITVYIIWWAWDFWPMVGRDIWSYACELGLRIAGVF